MSLDASFEKVEKVIPHPGADRLEIAIVSNYQVVCGKGEVKPGDVVFYIRDDAKLKEYDRIKEYDRKRAEIEEKFWKNKRDLEYNLNKLGEFKWRWKWQEPLVKYLGGGGRVKTIKLRGEYSSGIIVPVEKVYSHINEENSKDFESDNEKIKGDNGGPFLLAKFGILHYSIPIRNVGDMSARGNYLPYSLWKTDEENFQSIDESLFPWGDEVLVTKKLDGSSESISATPDGEIHIMSRSMDLMVNSDNNFTRAAKPIIPLIKEYAKKFNKIIVVRGEMTSANTNKNKSNIDAVGEPTFHMFATVFPEETEYSKKIGMFGTENHFLEVNKRIKEITGCEILTVPIIGIEKLTKELLFKYRDMPKEFGEGVVFNLKSEKLPHFKSKSMDYLSNLN